MTRLSDLLRGAADRAPVGEASVSIREAHRRIRVQRGVRGVANGLAGAGAAALIVVGVINPTIAASSDGADSALAPVPADDGGMILSGNGAERDSYYSGYWGACGANLYEDIGDTTEALTLTVDPDGLLDLEGGTTVDIPTSLSATGDLEVRTTGPEAVLLYDGIVVARLGTVEAEQILDLASGDIVDSTLSFPLVNCFDGAALPAAEYELVVSQGFATVTIDPGPEPSPEPSWTPVPEPSVEPTPLPEPSPVPEPTLVPRPNPLPSVEDGSIGASSIAVVPEPEIMPVEPSPWDSREVTSAVTLTVAGDPVDDPFGAYIWSPPEKPTDFLTPALARELYQAGLVSGTWDMAPGTSRWIIPNYETASPVDSMRIAAPGGWYGCSWDGSTGLTFPTQSAILDLLDVSATFPSRINLSYGWVVDDNPEVHYSVTNTSEYSLPGFYGEPNHSLYLVKDGRVVAEAYPQNMNPYNGGFGYQTVTASTDTAAEYWGILSPGTTLTGDYLWRDVNGCWTDSGPRTVTAGVYTLMTMQSLYVDDSGGGYPILYAEDETVKGDGNTGVAEPGLAPEPVSTQTLVDPGIDPTYTYDSVELQVWTSLGSVTITTD
jgi:hypothetical protein